MTFTDTGFTIIIETKGGLYMTTSTAKVIEFPIHLVQKTSKKQVKSRTCHHTASDPIRDEQDILKAKEWLLNQPQRYANNRLNIRNYLLFTIGINLGRRIGDTRNLTVGDFVNPDGTYKTYLEINEQKTGKPARIYINAAIREALPLYIEKDTSLSDYLFQSRTKNTKNGTDPRMTIQRVNQIYQEMAKAVGIAGHISSHSTRKTAVYRMIQNGKNDMRTLINVQKFCNHSDFSTTLRYAGIQQEELDELCKSIEI